MTLCWRGLDSNFRSPGGGITAETYCDYPRPGGFQRCGGANRVEPDLPFARCVRSSNRFLTPAGQRPDQNCGEVAKPGRLPVDVNVPGRNSFCELGPTIRDQAIGILLGHLDDAIFTDRDVPAREGLHGPDPDRSLEADVDRLRRLSA